MRTETQITADLIKHLRHKCHAMILNLHGHAMQAAGWPDFYISHWECHAWIECKGPKTVVQPLQKKIMTELSNRNEYVFILRFTLPKVYSLRTISEEEIIADMYGTPKEISAELINALSKI